MDRRNFVSTLMQAGVATAALGAAPRTAAEAGRPRVKIGQFGTGHAHADGKLPVQETILRASGLPVA